MTGRWLCLVAAASGVACDPCDGTVIAISSDDGAPVVQACVEVAVTAEERRAGLAGRLSISPDGGMLFEFPVTGEVCMTGEGMLFPVVVIFVDEEQSVLSTARLAPGVGPICERATRYVVELPVDEVAPRAGDDLIIER